jgi:hypothetical protein
MFKISKFIRRLFCFHCINAERKETEIIYKKIRGTDYEDETTILQTEI